VLQLIQGLVRHVGEQPRNNILNLTNLLVFGLRGKDHVNCSGWWWWWWWWLRKKEREELGWPFFFTSCSLAFFLIALSFLISVKAICSGPIRRLLGSAKAIPDRPRPFFRSRGTPGRSFLSVPLMEKLRKQRNNLSVGRLSPRSFPLFLRVYSVYIRRLALRVLFNYLPSVALSSEFERSTLKSDINGGCYFLLSFFNKLWSMQVRKFRKPRASKTGRNYSYVLVGNKFTISTIIYDLLNIHA
jgi:hypothetical protein